MLGELPFASRRNLFGAWNHILPELVIGLLRRCTLFSSWKSAWTCGAAARFSRMRLRRAFRSAGESESAEARGARNNNASAAQVGTDRRAVRRKSAAQLGTDIRAVSRKSAAQVGME